MAFTAQLKQIVIIGGGFGGLQAAKALSHETSVKIALLDSRNHHLFQPLLYQVATAGLSPADIAVPIRSQFSSIPQIEVHLAKVIAVDLKTRNLNTTTGVFHYDYLVVSCGASHNYFGHPEWEEFAPGLKTLEHATEMRRRILYAFESAENEADVERQKAFMTFVIVGGGPTGVELAGAMADISRTVLLHDFRRINPATARIILIEAGPRLLASFDKSLSERARRDLTDMGVEVFTSTRVEHIDSECVRVAGAAINAKTIFWAAGVQASPLLQTLGVPLDRAGRVKVNQDLSIPGFAEAFVIGDAAAFETRPGQILPGLAPVAIQQGAFVAKEILMRLGEETSGVPASHPRTFHYVDKGQMATIGKRRAILQKGQFKLWGYLAWLGWLLIHIFYLIGFKNRVSVLLQWAWSYTFSKRGARLITTRDWR